MGNGKMCHLTESKPLNWLIRNHECMIICGRYAPTSYFVKIGSMEASGEMGEI